MNAQPNGKKLSLGSFRMSDKTASPFDTYEQRLLITEIVKHPDFDEKTFNNDIAVIKVNSPLTCVKKIIWPVCLPTQVLQTILFISSFMIKSVRVLTMLVGGEHR